MKDLSETGAAWTPSAPVSVSDQIRALDKAGLPRAEIARRLGKRCQHVRNVLEGDKARDPHPATPARSVEGFQAIRGSVDTFYRLVVARDASLWRYAKTSPSLPPTGPGRPSICLSPSP